MTPEQWNEYLKTCQFFRGNFFPNELPPIGNQLRTKACMAFALSGCLSSRFWHMHNHLTVNLSELQVLDTFGSIPPTIEEIRRFIWGYGLLESRIYPWRASVADFIMPPPPVTLYYGQLGFVLEKDGRNAFKNWIRSRPVASYFVVTESYTKWCGDGCRGVFTYKPWELFEVWDRLTNPEIRDQVRGESHMVILLGFGVEKEVDFYLVRDSHGTSHNNGYRKICSHAFYELISIEDCWRTGPLRENDYEYQNLRGYIRPGRPINLNP